MESRLAAVAAASALSICMVVSTAVAGSVTQSSELICFSSGAPLTPGLHGGQDTRGWFHLVLPLWTLPAMSRNPGG
jgi:hypothetical protein